MADILERATLRDINNVDEPVAPSSDDQKIPKITKLESTLPVQYGEMEMVLSGLELSYLIPIFQENKVKNLRLVVFFRR